MPQFVSSVPIGHLQNYLLLTVDFTSATWNTAATHELFTVTGLVRMQLIPECTEDLASAGGSISLGTETNTSGFIAATVATTIDNGELWLTGTPIAFIASTSIIDDLVNGSDVGYEITVGALTDGTMKFHCFWEPIGAGATVVAGAGGVL